MQLAWMMPYNLDTQHLPTAKWSVVDIVQYGCVLRVGQMVYTTRPWPPFKGNQMEIV